MNYRLAGGKRLLCLWNLKLFEGQALKKLTGDDSCICNRTGTDERLIMQPV